MREAASTPSTNGYVSYFKLRNVSSLHIRVFPTADADWLHCVVAHRRGAPFESLLRDLADVDAIVGKVANDQTNATILAYLSGAYGETGTPSADAICLSLLLPDRLQDQVCLRTSRAIACLTHAGSEIVCL